MWEPCHCEPCEPCRRKQNRDECLEEIAKQFVTIEEYELKRSQDVFHNVFNQLKKKMEEKSNYFKKYCREVLRGGSVYDGTKVSHMNEFDMDIVIGLPVCYDQIVLENDQPGFLRLKITAFDHLDKQPDWEQCHKETRDWRDSEKYLLQNKIRQWLQGIVARAIYDLGGQVEVNGTVYLVKYKESGPAYTLQIRNNDDEQFQLDVDLVPVIKFQQPKWPKGYKPLRQIHGSQVRNWLLIPKPNKAIQDNLVKNRCWRLSFQDYERELMKGKKNLKSTIRMVKKLQNVLDLKSIASYYIKTLFLWEIEQGEDNFWINKLSVTFEEMVAKLLCAVKDRKIMYFWHQEHNLLDNVSQTTLKTYEHKLKRVLGALYSDDCETIVDSLLTANEMRKLKNSEFYKKFFKPSLRNESSIQVYLQPPQPFRVENKHDDNVVTLASTSSAWQKWRRSFEIFYEACELSKKETKVQINMLLHIIGDQGLEVYDNFENDFETVEELLEKFEDVFLPKKNVTAVRHKFFGRDQKDSESIEQYVTELKELAIKCEFKECNNLVRDRLIYGLKDKAIKEKILAEANLTTTKIIKMCKLGEASHVKTRIEELEVNKINKEVPEQETTPDAPDVQGNNKDDDEKLSQAASPALSGDRPRGFVEDCSYCGSTHKYYQCPAYGEICYKCKRLNHFEKVCRSRDCS